MADFLNLNRYNLGRFSAEETVQQADCLLDIG